MPKTLVKLRRTPSDTPRPASTPPVIAASAIQDEDDEEKIIVELEVTYLLVTSGHYADFFFYIPYQCDNMSLPHSFNNGSQIFQRVPVNNCNKRYTTLLKATPNPPCTFGSLGRKVKFINQHLWTVLLFLITAFSLFICYFTQTFVTTNTQCQHFYLGYRSDLFLLAD